MFSATERGTAPAARGVSTAPVATAPTAAGTPCVVVKLPEGEYAKHRPNEADDNDRWDTLALTFCRNLGRDIGRVSWHWPETFFMAEPGQFQQQFGRISQRATFPPAFNPDGRLLHELYAGEGSSILADFYDRGRWFERREEADLSRDFLFRRGDVVIFGKGHSSIVTGEQTLANVVLSHMSWNRMTQAHFHRHRELPAGEHYGVTRNRLVTLRAAKGTLVIFSAMAGLTHAFVHYRLKPEFRHLQVFDTKLKADVTGRPYEQ